MPNAMPRPPSAKVRKISTMASGWITPAQRPWTMRRAINSQAPVATNANSDAAMNSSNPACTVSRAPKRASAQADSSNPAVMAARKPVDNHCANGRPMAKSAMIAGKATLMLVEASTIAMLPVISSASSQLG